MNYVPLLQAAAAGSQWIMPISLGLVFVVFYVFMIRPEKKEQKKIDEMRASLKKGDKIITTGGIYGTVSSVREKSVIIRVDDNCKLEVARVAIAALLNASTKAAAKGEPKADTKKDTKSETVDFSDSGK